MRLAIFLVVLLHVISQAEHRRDRGRARKVTLNSGSVAQNTGDIDKTVGGFLFVATNAKMELLARSFTLAPRPREQGRGLRERPG